MGEVGRGAGRTSAIAMYLSTRAAFSSSVLRSIDSGRGASAGGAGATRAAPDTGAITRERMPSFFEPVAGWGGLCAGAGETLSKAMPLLELQVGTNGGRCLELGRTPASGEGGGWWSGINLGLLSDSAGSNGAPRACGGGSTSMRSPRRQGPRREIDG